MAELPDQFRALDRARRLSIIQPLDNTLGMAGGATRARIRGTGGLDPEMAVALKARGLGGPVEGLVEPHVARLDQRGLDIEDVDLVQHALDQALDGVLGRAIGPQAGHAERARGGREDQVAAVGLGAEVREGELQDVEGAEHVGRELVAQVVVVLVFAGADDAVACAVCNYVNASPSLYALFNHVVYCLPHTYIA